MSAPLNISRYAAFLCAAHESFSACPHKLDPKTALQKRFQLRPKSIDPSRKPWKGLLALALKIANSPRGSILEFGVYNGQTLNYMAKSRPQATLHGFDSFTGFPDDGRPDWQQNMAVAKPPDITKNINLHVGYFAQTLPTFIATHQTDLANLGLLHIDCDLYSSTKTVLAALSPYLHPGHLIVFDELMHYQEFASNEFLAFYEFLCAHNLDFEWAATVGRAYPYRKNNGIMEDIPFGPYRAQGHYQNQAIRLVPRHKGRHFNVNPAPDALIANLKLQLAAHALNAK